MGKFSIEGIHARQILDSRGNPTVEVDIFSQGFAARAAVPSGASTGSHEAIELRDGGKDFHGKSVKAATRNITEIIAGKLIGMDCREQEAIDKMLIDLDGTQNKSRLGSNSLLAVSMACCKLAASAQNEPTYQWISNLSESKPHLPIPFINIINGGAHAGNDLDIQEFMITPNTGSFFENTKIASEIYQSLKTYLKNKYGKSAINVGDEGGFAPLMKTSKEALDALVNVIAEHGYQREVFLALDCAASEFFSGGAYHIEGKRKSAQELLEYYKDLLKTYPIISIEDPFAEDDFDGFSLITNEIGSEVQVVGDDLLVTNTDRIKQAISKKACNALLLKVNQIGTITESLDANKKSKSAGWSTMVSHRSGETNDDFISDLSVGLGSQIKIGAPCRGERVSKYNRLIRIEETLSN